MKKKDYGLLLALLMLCSCETREVPVEAEGDGDLTLALVVYGALLLFGVLLVSLSLFPRKEE